MVAMSDCRWVLIPSMNGDTGKERLESNVSSHDFSIARFSICAFQTDPGDQCHRTGEQGTKRRTRVVGTFLGKHALLRLARETLRDINEEWIAGIGIYQWMIDGVPGCRD